MHKTITPMGARIFVEPIEAETSLEKQAEKINLKLVLEERSKPRPTTGTVVALGEDPAVQALLRVGDQVIFSRFAGSEVQVEGTTYLCLELHELISVIREEADPPAPVQSPPRPS